MKQPWMVSVPINRAEVLCGLRLEPAVSMLADGSQLWMRGPDWTERIARRIIVLPAIQIFHLTEFDELIPFGKTVPIAKAPDGAWQPIREWFPVQIPVAAFPAELCEKVSLRLVRGEGFRSANVIEIPLEAWCNYAEEAPMVRLNCWRFATNGNGSALVCGIPLPPLHGDLFCEEQGIAIEAGLVLEPDVDLAVVRTLLELQDRDLALLRGNESVEIIRSSDFVRATRAAIRSTRLAHAIP